MGNTEDFFKKYRGKYSQYWIERWGLIPELPTSFDNANSIYELLAWLQRAFKNLLDDFQQLEAESEDFKNALIDLLEYLIPELIRRYHDSAEFRAIFITLLKDILAGEERTWVKDLLKELLEVDMREWIEVYLKELYGLELQELENKQQQTTEQLVQTKSDLETIAIVGEQDTLIVDASKAVNGGATNVATKNDEYVVTENLYPFAEPIVMTGKGKITHLNHNNRYFDIFNPRHSSGVLTKLNPSYDSANLSKFKTALATAKGGGAKVNVTFVGDSLTQGGHRKDDNFFWVEQLKNKLIERYGDYFKFYNRGWAGRVISDLKNVVSTTISAPFENNWVTASGTKTWLGYIAETTPDLIVSAFGMNEMDADVYVDLANGRTALKGIASNPDIVWVTTPISTVNTEAVNNGRYFGRYPNNEFTNTAGIVTRLFAQRMGDAVIDVNRNTSIAMLGLDPYQYRMDRWAGIYRKTDNQFTAPEGAVTGGTGNPLNIALSNSQSIETNRLFRNASLEFTPTGTLDTIRIWFRRDTTSDSYTMVELSNTRIALYGRFIDTLSMGEIVLWTGDCRNQRVRIDVIGSSVKVFVANTEILVYKNNLASQFLAPITFQTMGDTTDSLLSNVIINGDYYKQYIPRISANEAFNVSYGDGGNGLNHPNTRGELEFYSQPIDEFISNLTS